MERLKQRIGLAEKALKAFEEALQMPISAIVRDAAIQRFEFTVEAIWKLTQLYLQKKEGIQEGSPKGVFRACLKAKLLDEHQTAKALEMINDRNLTVHTYNEGLADKIHKNLQAYRLLCQHLIVTISQRS